MKTLVDLSLDVKMQIANYLDNRSLAQLSQTCTHFADLIKSFVSFREIRVRLVDDIIPQSLDILNYRAGIAIGTTFYMPLINGKPICYTYDMIHGIWSTEQLHFVNMPNLLPQITCASFIKDKIYLVCGRLLNSYTLSNGIIEIDIKNFNTRLIKDTTGNPPRPRHEHSVDVIVDRYLVVFGGLCYNSVGENDVFVYDTQESRWFVPPIKGQVPHLRFGHASAVIGYDLYIHGGAQLDNSSSYIVYDDLYKLDCETWTWYKFEHPEVERYLRAQSSTPLKNNHLIPSFGDSPLDRFQSYMCVSGKKLVIFGGHSIREDDNETEVVYTYPLDELSIFNTKLCAWTFTHADRDDTEDLNVSDMSVAMIHCRDKDRIFVVAARKPEQVPRANIGYETPENEQEKQKEESYFYWDLPHMVSSSSNSHTPKHESDDEHINANHDESDVRDNVIHKEDKSHSEYVCNNVETRAPNLTHHSDSVKDFFHQDPDMLSPTPAERKCFDEVEIFQSPPLSVSLGGSETPPEEEKRKENNSKSNKPHHKVDTCVVFIDLIE